MQATTIENNKVMDFMNVEHPLWYSNRQTKEELNQPYPKQQQNW